MLARAITRRPSLFTGSLSPVLSPRRALHQSAPSTIPDRATLLTLPFPELLTVTRHFLTETGYRMPESRSSMVASSLIDAFASQPSHVCDTQQRQLFINSLQSIKQFGSEEMMDGGEPQRSPKVFGSDYSVDQLLLDALPSMEEEASVQLARKNMGV